MCYQNSVIFYDENMLAIFLKKLHILAQILI
jgi:hypothetical protein